MYVCMCITCTIWTHMSTRGPVMCLYVAMCAFCNSATRHVSTVQTSISSNQCSRSRCGQYSPLNSSSSSSRIEPGTTTITAAASNKLLQRTLCSVGTQLNRIYFLYYDYYQQVLLLLQYNCYRTSPLHPTYFCSYVYLTQNERICRDL